MDTDVLTALLSQLRADMHEEFQGLNRHLDQLDARTRKTEVNIGVLMDRSNRAERTAIWYGTGAGTAVAALVQGIAYLFKRG